MENRLDIIVFGATGFTGKHVLPYLHKLCPNYGSGLTWGIAGKSEWKLKQILVETSESLGVDNLNSIPIAIADVANEDSILQMAKKAKTIINCCGPYELYGEVVVKSCIEAGSNYVDVTGESYFEELIEMKYHEAAQEKGVYIVSSCGFDSINSVLSLAFLEDNFQGTMNSVEMFVNPCKISNQGPTFNYGSWETVVNVLGQFRSLFALRKKRNLKPLPKLQPKYWPRLPFTKDTRIGIPEKRIIPVPVTDIHVINRSQRYFYENGGKRPLQVQHYYLIESWTNIFLLISFGIIILCLAQFRFGKKLLLTYPRLFTAGLIAFESPSEKAIGNTIMDTYFYGKGWGKDITQGFDKIAPNKSVLGRLHVENPGYGFTCLAVTLSAILLITERSKLPAKGGVYTPAVAFNKTSFVKTFQKNDVQLEILSIKDL